MDGQGRTAAPTLGADEYWDKVYACWQGKNCGGTLGAPLEEVFGRDEPFDIAWYPELRAGGIPNDDLELQLILLKAVEERGFDLSARELAQYWLDHIVYNFDEYGLHKANLRLGLPPPVSGHYNNWFRDCMGAPIRSEIWACLAPGDPALAVHYAYQDAIVDHAGGEGVWGEMFNAAVESAAFVERDPRTLLDIGLSYIPPDCATVRAVRAARAAHAAGVDWREARRRVLAAAPHYNAQYAPPNIGFQVIGWLYGADFGDALCTAVNCGYDTDCTGATLGALLGILAGRAGLPDKWTAPLGDGIATNESRGGLRHVSTGDNPIPRTLRELTDRVCALGPRLLALRGAPVQIGERTNLRGMPTVGLRAPDDAAARWWTPSPLQLRHTLDTVSVDVAYGDAPVIAPGAPTPLGASLHNPHPEGVTLDVRLAAPDGWVVEPAAPRSLDIPAHVTLDLRYTVRADAPAHVRNSNRVTLAVQPHGRPAEPAVPVVLVGARRWLVWRWTPTEREAMAEDLNADALLDRRHAPEDDVAGRGPEPGVPVFLAMDGPREGWTIAHAPDNALPESIGAEWTGVVYARLFLWSLRAREVRVGIPATCPRKLWLNGHLAHTVRGCGPLRPNYGHNGGDGVSYLDHPFHQGWNEVLIKYTRDGASPPFAAHVTLSTPDMYHGLVDIGWTRLPWDGEDLEFAKGPMA